MLTKHRFPDNIEALFIEINFRKWKQLLCGLYHPPSQSGPYLFDNLDKALDVYSTYQKVLITEDFNAQVGEKCLDTFLYQHKLNLPSCIDLILTNTPRSFFDTETYFTGLSDCHQLVLSVFKTIFSKTGPKEMMYRDYKNFDQDIFSQELCKSLSSKLVLDYTSFEENFLGVLNKYTSLKNKVLCATMRHMLLNR